MGELGGRVGPGGHACGVTGQPGDERDGSETCHGVGFRPVGYETVTSRRPLTADPPVHGAVL
jgi:hypothetical protein